MATKTNAPVAGTCTQAGPAVSESFAYNNFDQPVSHTNNGSTTTYAYDAAFGLVREVQPMGTVAYGYDAYGRDQTLTWPDGVSISYGYDNANRITTVTDSWGAALATYAYDPFRLLSLTRGDGVTTSYSYDPLWRVSNLATTLAAGSGGAANGDNIAMGLGYSIASQVKARTLTTSNPAYVFTPSASATTYTINGLNQIASIGAGAGFTYDPRGNLTSDGTTTYGYNANNLLVSTSAGATLAYDEYGYPAPAKVGRFQYTGPAGGPGGAVDGGGGEGGQRPHGRGAGGVVRARGGVTE